MKSGKKVYYRSGTRYIKKKNGAFSIMREFIRKKLFAAIIAILLLAAVGSLIWNHMGSTSADTYLTVGTAGRMLTFTELDHEALPEFLDKKGEDYLTCEDAQKILEELGLHKTIKTDWTISGEHDSNILKKDWLDAYDEITAMLDQEQIIQFKKLYLIGDRTVIDGLQEAEVYTEKGVYTYGEIAVKPYLKSMVEAIILEGEILCIREKISEEAVLQNVWISEVSGKGFEVFADGYYIPLSGGSPAQDVEETIADIVMMDGEITAIRTKQEQINGKILAVQDEGIEIEGYGLIPFAEGFRIYKVYNGVTQLTKEDLILGYEQTEFIVADGKICGGLIVKSFSAENIRVLIKTTGYKALTHGEITITPDSDYTISYGEEEEEYEAGKPLTIGMDSEYWTDSRIIVKPKELTGMITVNSIERGYGTPAYRGFFEIVKSGDGLVLINEVSIEEYLYAVIPSEMPTSYGLEALKAQAVCARSYAYNHLESDTYSQYGAHVDDSTTFQVYQNNKEDEMSIKAVDETNGLVMQKDGSIIQAYYFSTSSGHTTTDAAWGIAEASNFLEGTFVGDETPDLNLSEEEQFAAYIKSTDYEAYDKEEAWYRWSFTLSQEQLGNIVDEHLPGLMKSKPDAVTVKTGDDTYEQKSINSIGKVTGVRANKRGAGGVIEELIITGEAAEIKVTNENVIRQLLAVGDKKIKKNDDTEVNGGNLLPSAYFYVEQAEEEGQISFRFYGGGYGHGIGMSQNAAKTMAGQGMGFQEILEFFYQEVEIKEAGQ